MKKNNNQGWLSKGIKYFIIIQLLNIFLIAIVFAEPQRITQKFVKGDALRLTIWQVWGIGDGKNQGMDLNGDFLIDSQGYVFFPLIGNIKVVGHNSTTLAELLKEKFGTYIQDPIIIVESLIRVTLLGAFKRPGTYLIPPGGSFWGLIDLAGGPADNSNLKKLRIERGGKVVRKNLLSAFERAYSLQEMGIRSGDQIVVSEKSQFRFTDAFEILRFGISILNLYFLVDRINK